MLPQTPPCVWGARQRYADREEWEELKREENAITRPTPMCRGRCLRSFGRTSYRDGASKTGIRLEKLDHIHEKWGRDRGDEGGSGIRDRIDAVREEIGDTLFTWSTSRGSRDDPEDALRLVAKIHRRFSYIEKKTNLETVTGNHGTLDERGKEY